MQRTVTSILKDRLKSTILTELSRKVSLALNGKQQDISGHVVMSLELHSGYAHVNVHSEIPDVRSHLVDGVVAGSVSCYVGEQSLHSNRSLSVLDFQLGNDERFDRWQIQFADSLKNFFKYTLAIRCSTLSFEIKFDLPFARYGFRWVNALSMHESRAGSVRTHGSMYSAVNEKNITFDFKNL